MKLGKQEYLSACGKGITFSLFLTEATEAFKILSFFSPLEAVTVNRNAKQAGQEVTHDSMRNGIKIKCVHIYIHILFIYLKNA